MSTWTVVGTQIQKDGQSVFLAGVCYAPTPAGAATYTPGVGDWFAPPWNGIWERDFALMKGMGINNLRTYFFCCFPINQQFQLRRSLNRHIRRAFPAKYAI